MVDEVTDSASRAPSSPGGAARSRPIFAGKPQHPVAQALAAGRRANYALPRRAVRRPSSTAWRWTSSSNRYLDLRRSSATAIASPASSACCRRASSAIPIRRTLDYARRPRHRLPAHQHHPRRGRGRAPRAHLSAAGRACSASASAQADISGARRYVRAFQRADGASRSSVRAPFYARAFGALPAARSARAAPRADHGGDLPGAAQGDRARRLSACSTAASRSHRCARRGLHGRPRGNTDALRRRSRGDDPAHRRHRRRLRRLRRRGDARRSGRAVTVFETARTLGGRARRVELS